MAAIFELMKAFQKLQKAGEESSGHCNPLSIFHKHPQVTLGAILDADDRKNDGKLGKASEKFYWQNWGESVGPVRLARAPEWPKTKADVKAIIANVSSLPAPRPRLRVSGHSHSWTPIICSDDEVLIFCRDFQLDNGDRIQKLENHPDGSPLVRVTAGVRTGEVVEWLEGGKGRPKPYGEKAIPGLSADVVLDNVRYGGVIACGCHGTGWDVQTVSDMVYSMTVINYKGEEVVYDASHPDFSAAKCSFGLLGVTFDLTLKLDNNSDKPAVEVTHAKPKQRTFFADTDDARLALKKLVLDHYAVEMLWFPLNTYSIALAPIHGNVKRWDPLGDEVWVKLFTRTEVPEEGITTPRFTDPFETLISFLKVNFGTNLKKLLETFAVESKLPGVSALFGDFAHNQSESGNKTYVTTLPRAIHWQKSVDDVHVNDLEFCFKVDEDFKNVQMAWMAVTTIMDKWINIKKENPLNIACEWRFTAHSDALMSPAYGKPGDHFCWIEVLSLIHTPSWDEFADEVVNAWMLIPGARPKPHWAKWNVPKKAGKADLVANLAKDVFADQITEFAKVVKTADPEGLFQTKWLTDLFGLQ